MKNYAALIEARARADAAEKALELACQTRNAAVDATAIVCKERDRLLMQLEEKTKEHGSDSMGLSIIVEKRELELAAARAAHSEAHSLVVKWSQEARGPYPDRDACLAKHGGKS